MSAEFVGLLGPERTIALVDFFQKNPVAGHAFYEFEETMRVVWLKKTIRELGFPDEFNPDSHNVA